MALKETDRLKAATLMETIVAMVVLMIVFLISTMVIQNVLHHVQIGTKVKASFMLQQWMEETLSEHQFFDDEQTVEYGLLVKSVKPSPLSDSLQVITIEAKDEKGRGLSYIRQTVSIYE